MQRTIGELVRNMPVIRPSEALESHIIMHIRKRAVRRARLVFFSSSTLAIVSIGGLVPAIRYLGATAASSGFGDYLSLAISENTNLIKYWKEFSLTLVESMPLVAVCIVLSAVCAFLWSGTRAAKNARLALSAA